jgi:hypothetical protein
MSQMAVIMRNKKVCIYGGTDLQGLPVEFISELAYKILASKQARIVTGGFLHAENEPDAVSTDSAALTGARRYASEHGIDLRDCYEAWIPDRVGGVVQMTENHGITVKVMKGRTRLGRRLAMVAGVHMVITISGGKHTEVVVEQALELGLPTLPIPVAGGVSKRLLANYRQRIAAGFDPKDFETCLSEISETIHRDPKAAASSVVKLIDTAKFERCLVLLPYDDFHNQLYASLIESAVANHMVPVRLDRLPTSEVIATSFADAIRSSSAVIADITLLNENVIYEIGFAHGAGLMPLIYTRDAARLKQLPLYFRTLNVRLASEQVPVNILIEEHLRSVKASRRGF